MNKSKQDHLHFEDMTYKHMKQLFRLAYARMGNSVDAEDVVQETYLKAFRGFASFKNKAQTKTWLTRILINTANDHLRKNNRTVFLLDGDETPEQSGLGPEEMLCVDEMDPELSRALHALPATYLAPLVLREIYEVSYDEIARVLELPKGTVMSRLFRARALLRKNLLAATKPG